MVGIPPDGVKDSVHREAPEASGTAQPEPKHGSEVVVFELAQAALTDAGRIKAAISAYEQAGCDELLLIPGSPDPGQVDKLAAAVGR